MLIDGNNQYGICSRWNTFGQFAATSRGSVTGAESRKCCETRNLRTDLRRSGSRRFLKECQRFNSKKKIPNTDKPKEVLGKDMQQTLNILKYIQSC